MITNSWLRVTAWAAGLVAVAAALFVVYVLYRPLIEPVLHVLLPFSIAVALALLLDPTMSRLERHGVPRGASIGIVAIIFLSIVAVLAVFVIPAASRQATELSANWPKYYADGEGYLGSFTSTHQGLLRRFHLPTTAKDLTAKIAYEAQNAAQRSFGHVGTWLADLLGKAVWIVLIPIITIFLLADIDRIKRKSLLVVPTRHRERTGELASRIGGVFGAYIRGLISVALLYGIVCGIALATWGVPYAILLGAAAGALSLVPYIGTISTLMIVALVSLVTHTHHPILALWVALTILAINQIFDNVVSPRIVGKAVGLHPALAILALLIGGEMFGIVGMILSVPIAASIQILVLEFYPPLRGGDEEVTHFERPPFLSRLLRRLQAGRTQRN